MRLHVLAGCRDLLEPKALAPEEVASLVGPGVRAVPGTWIEPGAGERYHDFLQEKPGDRRVAVMAEAIKDAFGSRFQPLLILADLFDEVQQDFQRSPSPSGEDRRTQFAVLEEIIACGHIRQLQLHGVALPSKADPDGAWALPAAIVPGKVRDRIERLRGAVTAEAHLEMVETHVIEVTPDKPLFGALYNNAISNQLVRKLEPRLVERGWTLDREALAATIVSILSKWNERGILAGLPLSSGNFDNMSNLVYEKLLQG
jgi:hypothetical protein